MNIQAVEKDLQSSSGCVPKGTVRLMIGISSIAAPRSLTISFISASLVSDSFQMKFVKVNDCLRENSKKELTGLGSTVTRTCRKNRVNFNRAVTP